ncbi:MAG: hypothetical protein ACOYXA_08190 [Bacteroidota bacterium]
MELLETQDPEKRRLIETSERHRRELEKEVKGMAQKTERVLTNALVIGGALALTYLAVSQFTKKSKTKKIKKKQAASEVAASAVEHEVHESSSPSLLRQIGTKVMDQATIILLDIARQKLAEYVQNRKTEDEPS